jgi:uncharacterized membrane protein
MGAKFFSIIFYVMAVVAQVGITAYALNLFFRSKQYRLASGLLALSFGLMIGRRVAPILLFYTSGHYNLFDAFLALSISLLMFFGRHFERLVAKPFPGPRYG